MEKTFNFISVAGAAVGGTLAVILGGWDKWLIALVSLACLDYITGIIKAIYEKKLSSGIGFKGICKKVLMFAMIAVAVAVEKAASVPLREFVICFYTFNESLSIIENAGEILPIPQKLRSMLLQLRDGKGDDSKNGDDNAD